METTNGHDFICNPDNTPSGAEPLYYTLMGSPNTAVAPTHQRFAAEMVKDLLTSALFGEAAGYHCGMFAEQLMRHHMIGDVLGAVVGEHSKVHLPPTVIAEVEAAATALMKAMDLLGAGYHTDGADFRGIYQAAADQAAASMK